MIHPTYLKRKHQLDVFLCAQVLATNSDLRLRIVVLHDGGDDIEVRTYELPAGRKLLRSRVLQVLVDEFVVHQQLYPVGKYVSLFFGFFMDSFARDFRGPMTLPFFGYVLFIAPC